MTKKRLCVLLAGLMSVFVLSTAGASQDELAAKSKKAKKQDVLGTWEMTYQIVRPGMKTSSLFFAPFQMLQFSDDDFIKNLASTDKMSKEDAALYLETMPKAATFSFVADGFLVIERSPKDFSNIMISIIMEDLEDPLHEEAPLLKKGELILSYLDPDQQIYMQRFFKKAD